jgi:hypothetical protein
MRVSALPDVLTQIHQALFDRFKIPTSDGSRFLGMGVAYDRTQGMLQMGMKTYIQSTMNRFLAFDTTLGCPYREIVGCLLWIVLCVVGPELVRVKDLARRSNNSTPLDYAAALKVLKRLWKRRDVAIIFNRGSAGTEFIPSQTRPLESVPVLFSAPPPVSAFPLDADNFPIADGITDIPDITVPVNTRFSQVGFTDAAFAVGDDKESFSGFIIYVNGTPTLIPPVQLNLLPLASVASIWYKSRMRFDSLASDVRNHIGYIPIHKLASASPPTHIAWARYDISRSSITWFELWLQLGRLSLCFASRRT